MEQSNNLELETKVELFEMKAATYQQKWLKAEDTLMTYSYMSEKDKQLLAEKEQEIQHLKEHIEKLEKNLNNLKGPVKLDHQKN
ncbi:hypothetical protein OQZ55_03925 [Bacillus subtilis]|uniref:hypothetical protein n=1 Tax=Bacillus subtilis TaxID=1423 RepID=UPI0021B11429|nr:hypothetical protein [Bacillus subtilis]MCT6514749.1 hypothetical protein [Bacillus subtilis]MCX4075393.1 hypothetical protein [Bacillus subtilis]MEC0395514.1 hypothetical protein [Bacillus subtilis]WRS92273.1 hypothetical protein VDS57_13310 [Bacillus subtilis]WRU06467.1 hypothetical protein VDS58_03630 [Bacillus subtilis]